MTEVVYGIATHRWPGWEKCVESWKHTATSPHPSCTVYNEPVLEALQSVFTGSTEEVIAYIHDDVVISEHGWDVRVLKEFEDPTVGLVGFGGALRHGSPEMYRVRYAFTQLGRSKFLSNMREAEIHGERFKGERDVAVLDGFAMFVRRSILEKAGGWPLNTGINYFCYDMWLSCEVRRQGYRIRLVGVECDHLSGKTAGMIQLKDSHASAHRWLYDHSRDVLPFSVHGK